MGTAEVVPTYKINQVEVFSAGEWNKDKYSVNDLHKMVEAFQNLKSGFKPYLKLGHDDKQTLAKSSGLPSVGWVDHIYVKGQKLYADLSHIPEKVFKLIKAKAYRKVSCEIYWDLDVNGIKYPRVLGAIALLGAEQPGVMNLDDILGLYSLDQNNMVAVFNQSQMESNLKQYEVNFDANTGDEMSEEQEKLNAELEASRKDYAAAKADLEKQAKEIAEAQEELQKYRQQAEQALAEATAAKVAKFVTELESKKLVTPAMKDIVAELMSDKKEYSFGEKKMSKEEAIEQVLILSQEAAKVNFDESSRADFAKKEDKMKDLEGKIEKYASENKVSYKQAYKAVMKDMKPMEDEEEK